MPHSHNWGIYGHEWAVDALKDAIHNGRARHAYLISGAEGIGKQALARALTTALQTGDPDWERTLDPSSDGFHALNASIHARIQSGNYPDLIYANPENGTLRIEEIRRVAAQIALKPFEGRHRVAIFRDFETALGRAQDALLKTLEEPAATGVLIVLARTLESILPTITSRSQMIRLRPIPQASLRAALMDNGADAQHAALLAALSGGRVGWALGALHDPAALELRDQALSLLETLLIQNRSARFDAAEDLSKDRDALRALLDLWLSYWRDLVLLSENADTPLTNIDRAAKLRQLTDALTPETALAALRATTTMLDTLETNASVRLALEIMLLDYPTLEAV
jgi:DNA polymerase-3 subunit delta'